MTMSLTMRKPAILLVLAALALASPASARPRAAHIATIAGTTQQVCGAPVRTWATVDSHQQVVSVGVTFPLSIIKSPPAKPGAGPVGAVAVLNFPKVVRDTTYFNHFELQWNPNGHPPACCLGVPHFDMHFYHVPVSAEMKVTAHDPAPPAAKYIPAGYIYPGPNLSVPQMGVHAQTAADSAPGCRLTKSMVVGYYGGRMTFIEPMVTRVILLQAHSFALPVPQPAALGLATRYPTKFEATFDPKAQAYNLVFSGFKACTK